MSFMLMGTRVLRVIAQSIGVDKNFFDSWTAKGNSLLRPIHYPPVRKYSKYSQGKSS
jgi:isopenicillin N synthase-like dioxygenase